MVGELMTLPVRVGVRVTRFALNTTLNVSVRALAMAGGALQSLAGQHDEAQHAPAPAPSRAPTQTEPKRAPSTPESVRREPAGDTAEDTTPAPVADIPAAPVEAEPEPEPEPAHVSEEPELVVEVAEPGAEEGAGASVTVDEPWEGYGHLNAKDIIDRLPDSGTAALAAIQLYESTHKQRETVLTAVERELRRESARARPD